MNTTLLDAPIGASTSQGTSLTVRQGGIEIHSTDLTFIGGFLAGYTRYPLAEEVGHLLDKLRFGIGSSSGTGYITGYLVACQAEQKEKKSQ